MSAHHDSKFNTILFVIIGILCGVAIMLFVQGRAPRDTSEDIVEETPVPVATFPTTEFHIENYVPPRALLQSDTSLDFNKDGRAERILTYALKNSETNVVTEGYIVAGNVGDGWTVLASSETPSDSVVVTKFTATNGTPSALVVEKNGSDTNWHVLTWNIDMIKTYNGVPARDGVLRSRGLVFHGGNVVTHTATNIVETVPGYTKDSDGTFPDVQPIMITYSFSGNALVVKKVEESVGPDSAL